MTFFDIASGQGSSSAPVALPAATNTTVHQNSTSETQDVAILVNIPGGTGGDMTVTVDSASSPASTKKPVISVPAKKMYVLWLGPLLAGETIQVSSEVAAMAWAQVTTVTQS